MKLYINKAEHETLEALEDGVDTIWNMASDMKQNCKSMIIGHDVKGEISAIEDYLKTASQKILSLKLAYEKELANN
jgi:hypothetical protein